MLARSMMKNCQEDEWERTVDVNCKGVMNGFGAVLKASARARVCVFGMSTSADFLSIVLQGMTERGVGHIITISSDAGRRIFPNLVRTNAQPKIV